MICPKTVPRDIHCHPIVPVYRPKSDEICVHFKTLDKNVAKRATSGSKVSLVTLLHTIGSIVEGFALSKNCNQMTIQGENISNLIFLHSLNTKKTFPNNSVV